MISKRVERLMYVAFIQSFYHSEFDTNVYCNSTRMTKVVRAMMSPKANMYALYLNQIDHEN